MLFPAFAARAETRNFTTAPFDRIRVEGPFSVDITMGEPRHVRADGNPRMLARLGVEVQGTTLVIHTDRTAWAGWQGEGNGSVTVRVQAPALSAAWVNGPAILSIDGLKASAFALNQAGEANVTVRAARLDRLVVSLAGSGRTTLSGTAGTARIAQLGSGALDSAGLVVGELDLSVLGSGEVTLTARQHARVSAQGPGTIDILGTPACTITGKGAGKARCTSATTR